MPSVDVAVPLPVQRAFTYETPEPLERGVRVLVSVGARKVVGLVTGPGEPGVQRLKPVLEVLDEVPLVSPPLLDLAAWIAEHYLAPPGECYRLALPPAGLRGSRAVVRLAASAQASADDPVTAALRDGPLRLSTLAHRLGRDPASRILRLRREGIVEIEQELPGVAAGQVRQVVSLVEGGGEPRGPAQARVLERLRAAGGELALAELVRDRPSWRGVVSRLEEAGLVALRELRRATSLGSADETRRELVPSDEQGVVLREVCDAVGAGRFAPFLLHGITGSGKTEVYFRATQTALAMGRGALILVPEIALTPLLVRAAVARFGSAVAVLHSEMSAGERHDHWWRVRDGEARVVIGARSALFAPLEAPGLIVVDEEHEASYKQDDSPRYHARDAAVMRARLEGVPVVLGSATPSVESYANAGAGKYTLVSLRQRFGSGRLPQVEIVDLREARKRGDDPTLTAPLRDALAARLERREQSLILLNRRGYATCLLCRECAEPATCPHCSVSLTLHRRGTEALCHYCGHRVRAANECAACGGEYLRLSGQGTERVAEAIAAAFPEARVDRLDRDVAARRGALASVLGRFESGQTDILVGTQMIAKGHDFPRVTLVGVIDADVGLSLPDFRAAERSFQLLTQVAGRAGRGDAPGEVILQSHLPDHYALAHACAQEYEAFFEREMEFRNTMGYPPRLAMVNLVFRSRDARRATEEARAVAGALREGARGYRVLGPAFSPLARLRGEHRVQVVLKGGRPAMRAAVAAALRARYGEVRWPGVAVDVDPISIL